MFHLTLSVIVVRKTTIVEAIKKEILQQQSFSANTLSHKLREKLLSRFPVLFVDTILYLWSFNFALYKVGCFQLFNMLRNGNLDDRQFIMYVTEVTSIMFCRKLHNSYSDCDALMLW